MKPIVQYIGEYPRCIKEVCREVIRTQWEDGMSYLLKNFDERTLVELATEEKSEWACDILFSRNIPGILIGCVEHECNFWRKYIK